PFEAPDFRKGRDDFFRIKTRVGGVEDRSSRFQEIPQVGEQLGFEQAVPAVAPLRPWVGEEDVDALEEFGTEKSGQAFTGVAVDQVDVFQAARCRALADFGETTAPDFDRYEGGLGLLFREVQEEFPLAG